MEQTNEKDERKQITEQTNETKNGIRKRKRRMEQTNGKDERKRRTAKSLKNIEKKSIEKHCKLIEKYGEAWQNH